MEKDKLRRKSLEEMIDEHIGKLGTEERDAFEEELRLDILGQTIKRIRKEKPPVKTKLINNPKFLSAKLPARLFLKENSNGRKKSTLY